MNQSVYEVKVSAIAYRNGLPHGIRECICRLIAEDEPMAGIQAIDWAKKNYFYPTDYTDDFGQEAHFTYRFFGVKDLKYILTLSHDNKETDKEP